MFTFLLMTLPLYAKVFYPKSKMQTILVGAARDKQQVKFTIQGLTCAGCEYLVNSKLSKVSGVIADKTSYAAKTSVVTFDPCKINIPSIQAAINKSGYSVKGYKIIISHSAVQTISEKECKSAMKSNGKKEE